MRYMIVRLSHVDYADAVRTHNLDPLQCTPCATYDEALYTSHRNDQWGIETTVLITDAWTAKHGYPRTGEVA